MIADNAAQLLRTTLKSEELDSQYSAGLVADMLQELARFLARNHVWAPDLVRYAERLRTGHYDWPEEV